MKKSFTEILSQLDKAREDTVKEKLPQWAEVPGLEYPSKLCLEQCSGTSAALNKARILGTPGSIADLTGGLGVDSWAFAQAGWKVDYFEMSPELSSAAQANFRRLGVEDRITVRCSHTDAGSVSALGRYDWIYLDPARRDSAGKKVFLLEDCTPNVLELLPLLWEHTSRILLKLSPMADISMLFLRLGKELRELQIVSHKAEVKELLCVMDKEAKGAPALSVVDCDSEARFSFTQEEEAEAGAEFSQDPAAGQKLFVPGAALMKSGAFKLLSQRFGLRKLAPSTHLYLGDGSVLKEFGRWYDIVEVLPFGKASFADIAVRFPGADVTARNIPMTSEQLRERIYKKKAPAASSEGRSSAHIFAVSTLSSRIMMVAI